MYSFSFRSSSLALACAASAAAWCQALQFSTLYAPLGTMQSIPTASCRDASGNFYLTGNAEAYLLTEKVSSAGTVLWRNYLAPGRLNSLRPAFVAVGKSGSVFVAAVPPNNASAGSPQPVMLFAVSSAGKTLWEATDSTHASTSGLALDPSDNPILAAPVGTQAAGKASFDLVSHSATNGALLWSKNQQDVSGILDFLSMTSDGGGGIFCLEVNGGSAFTVVKFSTVTGGAIWSKVISALSSETFQSPQFLTALSDGDQVVSGTGSFHTGSSYYTQVTFDRLRDSDGAFVYRSQIGDTSNDATTGVSAPPVANGLTVAWGGRYTLSPNSYGVAGVVNASGASTWQSINTAQPTKTLAVPNADGGAFAYFLEGGGSTIAPLVRFGNTGSRIWTNPLTETAPIDLSAPNGSPSATMILTSSLQDQSYGIRSFNGTSGAVSLSFSDAPYGYVGTTATRAAKDTSGNVYVTGGEGHHILVTKYSPAGAVVWSVVLYPTQAIWEGSPVSIAWSSRGELALGLTLTDPAVGVELGVAKLSAANGGTIWSDVYKSSQFATIPQQCLEDSLGNVIAISNSSSVSHLIFDKFDTATGKNVWEYATPDNFDTEAGFAIDANGNAFACGTIDYYSNGFIYNGFNLVAVSSAGKLIYDKVHSPAATAGPFHCALTVSATSTAILAVTDGKTLQAVAYSLAGVEKWYKSWTPSAPPAEVQAVGDSALGIVYFLTRLSKGTGSPANMLTLKCRESDGYQYWYNLFTSASGIVAPWVADFDSFGNIVEGLECPVVQNSLAGNQTYVRKLACATGIARYSAIASAPRTTILDSNAQLLVNGPTAVLVQTTPSLVGASSTAQLVSGFGDTNPPVCYNDSYSVAVNGTLTISAPGVLANDEDAAGATAILVAAPTHAKSFSLSANGGFSYSPAANFTGTDTFTYKATNAYGTSNVAVVTIKVS